MSDPTDPTPLAEQIAREHRYIESFDECPCGGDSGPSHALHIATVAERAVRERATRAVARMNITGPMRAIFTDPVYREALDALEVLVDQETQSALHCIDPG